MRAIFPTMLAVALASCGGCDDAETTFFEPTTFGTYRFEPEPDIDVPSVLDFGEVRRDTTANKTLPVANVGRLPLVLSGLDFSDTRFSVPPGTEEVEIASRDGVFFNLSYAARDSSPIRATLDIASNDPDESPARVLLLANQTTPCVGSFVGGGPVWQLHDGAGPMCWPEISGGHGHVEEYQYADVPTADDPGWSPESDNHISFSRRSSLCGTDCACRGGGDFTYFQTFVYLPSSARFARYEVDIRSVDDGARVTVFNEASPTGVTDPDSYARIPGGSSADLAPYFVTGMNRIVITHIDDCCSISQIGDVHVTADGAELERCGR